MIKVKKEFIYESKFAPYIKDFLLEKEQKGLLKSNVLKNFMLEFDRFFQEYDIKDLQITEDVILQWRSTRINDNDRNLYHKYIAWKHFCTYMCSIEVGSYIPRIPKAGRQNEYIPYIFTSEEIELFFKTVDRLRISTNRNITPMFAMPALFRLLYSTGIRISEAISLRNEDLDFENRIIYINKTKNEQQRLAVMTDSLFAVLQEYKNFKELIPIYKINAKEKFFFVTQLGKPCHKTNVRFWFQEVLYCAEIPKHTYVNRPRIHDLRHSSAVHSFQKLISQGMDLNCGLPMISIFLGHKHIRSTEHYVRLTSQMFPDLIEKQKMTSFVFPEMKFIKKNNYDGFW